MDETTERPAADRLPWALLVRWALVGTAVAVLLVLVDVQRTGPNVLNLVQPGARGPSHVAFEEDFPGAYLPDGTGHDGQQFYAIARDFWHPHDVAPQLGGNERYRLQRIFYPFLVWVLHPTGGGDGLVYAMVLVGIVATFIGGLAAGALTVTLGGKAWGALAFGLMPGVYAALRISTADHLAMALTLASIVFLFRRRLLFAVLLAIAAALTREVSIIALVGVALWKRDRESVAVVVAPVAAVGTWFLVLRTMFASGYGNDRTSFLQGVRDAYPYWTGDEGFASMLVVIAFVGLVVAAVVLRRHSPLLPSVLLTAALPLFLQAETMDAFFNATRTLMPTTLLAVLALLGAARPPASILRGRWWWDSSAPRPVASPAR